jgi:hypothetical protein
MFDFTLPVWRFGDALLHAERLARRLGDSRATVHFRAEWTGVEGRRLRSLWARRLISYERTAKEDRVVSEISTSADEISLRLAPILQELLNPVYTVFDFFEMPLNVIEEELTELRQARADWA